jgi:hypothetical protein
VSSRAAEGGMVAEGSPGGREGGWVSRQATI